MSPRSRMFCSGLIACLVAMLASATPELEQVRPAGGMRGSDITVGLVGKHLEFTESIIFYSPGFSAHRVQEPAQGPDGYRAPTPEPKDKKRRKKKNKNALKIQRASAWFEISVPADAPVGRHVFRVLTPTGLSDLMTFWVGPFPDIQEKEPNNQLSEAQRIELGVTVTGIIRKEDVDTFIVSARKGQRLTAEVIGMRMCPTFFDPQISIQDARRFDLAICDDTSLTRQDPFVSVLIPEDGDYTIRLREASYGGTDKSRYRLVVGNQPRPTMVYPAGGQVGKNLALSYLGDPSGSMDVTVPLPTAAVNALPLTATSQGLVPASPNYLRVSPFPSLSENGDNDERAKANVWTNSVPLAFDGVIEKKGDVDWFRFPAVKGQELDIRVYARSIRSPLDPVLGLYDLKGKLITRKDDEKGLDSYIRFKPKEDGEYTLRIRDHLNSGGNEYVYRIEVTPVAPHASLTVIPGKQYTQLNQVLAVPRGQHVALDMKTIREDCSGGVSLTFGGLPEGVSVTAPGIHDKTDDAPVVFSAEKDAPSSVKLVSVKGSVAGDAKTYPAHFDQQVELVHGQPNSAIYSDIRLKRLAVAVVDRMPYRIEIEPPPVPLVRSGQMRLKITVTRDEGFDKAIKLKMMSRPPGVGSESEITVASDKSMAYYNLNAGGDAVPGIWPICIQASSQTDQGLLWCSTPMINLEIAEPYLSGTIALAAVEQGGEVDLSCVIKQMIPFEGSAKVRLVGLPLKVTSDAKEITSEDKEIYFTLKTDKETPQGTHKSLFLSVNVMEDGHPVIHNIAGGGTLRVDPPQKTTGTKPAEKKTPAALGEKPLSRLEKLRFEAEQRRKAQMGGGS